MIAKRSASRLNKQSGYKPLADYLLDVKGKGRKVAFEYSRHCHADETRFAIKEIVATQALNQRTNLDKNYHLIVSFRETEWPGETVIRDVEERLCEAIGLGGHQRIVVGHQDREHLHMHIGINKIHPETFNSIEPYYDYLKLSDVCQDLERAHGLEADHHIRADRKKGSQLALEIESHSGVESFHKWVKGAVLDGLEGILEDGKANWERLHQELARFNLEIRKRGSGLVISDRDRKLFVKASDVSRELGKGALEKRFGAYYGPSDMTQKIEAEKKYEYGLLHGYSKEREGLYQKYVSEKTEGTLNKRLLLSELRKERIEKLEGVREKYVGMRAQVRDQDGLQKGKKKALYSTLKMERVQEMDGVMRDFGEKRQAIYSECRLLSWEEYLVREAEQGNDLALEVLRGRQMALNRDEGGENVGSLNRISGVLVRKGLIDEFEDSGESVGYRVHRNGDVTYTLGTGGTFKDVGRELRMGEIGEREIKTVLLFAQQKFGGSLDISGTEVFKKQVVDVALKNGLKFKFKGIDVDEGRKIER